MSSRGGQWKCLLLTVSQCIVNWLVCSLITSRGMHTFMFTWIPCVPHVQQISCVSHVYNDTICTTCLHRYVYHVFSWISYIPHIYMATMCITLGSPFMLNSPFWPHTSFLYSKVCICLSLSLSLFPPCYVWYECQQAVMKRANAWQQLRFQLTLLGIRNYM